MHSIFNNVHLIYLSHVFNKSFLCLFHRCGRVAAFGSALRAGFSCRSSWCYLPPLWSHPHDAGKSYHGDTLRVPSGTLSELHYSPECSIPPFKLSLPLLRSVWESDSTWAGNFTGQAKASRRAWECGHLPL